MPPKLHILGAVWENPVLEFAHEFVRLLGQAQSQDLSGVHVSFHSVALG